MFTPGNINTKYTAAARIILKSYYFGYSSRRWYEIHRCSFCIIQNSKATYTRQLTAVGHLRNLLINCCHRWTVHYFKYSVPIHLLWFKHLNAVYWIPWYLLVVLQLACWFFTLISQIPVSTTLQCTHWIHHAFTKYKSTTKNNIWLTLIG